MEQSELPEKQHSEITRSTISTSFRALSQIDPQSILRVVQTQANQYGKPTQRLMSLLNADVLIQNAAKTWDTASRLNYFPGSDVGSIFIRSDVAGTKEAVENKPKKEDDVLVEHFPINVTPLMNEDQLWGCFYPFPELYNDVYSPIVQVKSISDVPELIGGVLTHDVVSCCLTYLKRTPLLGDFVYIKLDLSTKHLVNIEVLQHYKFLVYLDLSVNFLTELKVLSNLQYLQFLSVSFNRLSTVLEYDVPQWFLSEVYYKYNSVKRINDLTMFWSITLLDLSHNNIKSISGLENLFYLRHLDLSFNHIQRLENLNNLHLVWLDVSYNNISSFEYGPNAGLWTLLHLEYLNLNENNLTSLKIFSGCNRLRDLHIRNNRFSVLLELAVYMKQLRRLIILDLRANPICNTPGYREVIITTFPRLLSLDAEELDPVTQRTLRMNTLPDVNAYACSRLLRLQYIEQLARAKISPFIPPADTREVPIVIFVGYEAIGKGKLVRRLAKECSNNVEMAMLHTTATYHMPGHYVEVTRAQFDDMLLAGDFLTYFEMEGESYGLSREEAHIKDGKLKISYMTLNAALMMKLRGRRPYLILTTLVDKFNLIKSQQDRRELRFKWLLEKIMAEIPIEKSTLQVMISGRILITGILNEIIMGISDETEKSEFMIESQCSLFLDSETRQAAQNYAKGVNMLTLLTSNFSSLENTLKPQTSKDIQQQNMSLCSLYKESQNTDEYASDLGQCGNASYQSSKRSGHQSGDTRTLQTKLSEQGSRPKSTDVSKHLSQTWKVGEQSVGPNPSASSPSSGLFFDFLRGFFFPGEVQLRETLTSWDSMKSSKSVTFTSQDDNTGLSTEPTDLPRGLTGLTVEIREDENENPQVPQEPMAPVTSIGRSVSKKFPKQAAPDVLDDADLWFSFLVETGLLQGSDTDLETTNTAESGIRNLDTKYDDPDLMMRQLTYYRMLPTESLSAHIRDDYEDIHRKFPGLFWDTISMDDPEAAFKKAKKILKHIVQSQSTLKPMFDIDFANMPTEYPSVQKKVEEIAKAITPVRYFT